MLMWNMIKDVNFMYYDPKAEKENKRCENSHKMQFSHFGLLAKTLK